MTVHFYKPSGWGAPNIYYYDDSVTLLREGSAWPGVAMQDEGNGCYVYRAPDWTQAKVIFNSSGNQIPGSQMPGYAVSGERWIKEGRITHKIPMGQNRRLRSINRKEHSKGIVRRSRSIDIDVDSGTYRLNGGLLLQTTN
ncbi:starch-binding protein [Paenibacillus polymyxa]|uniref:starch-binding protein n=1 Tax=Paenibacillus polymyxa TaxID=1406 RepID=UPI0020259F71|nr:starch-binding protein [Paenibacillus polymyxa]URJ45409.1 starch-binding protein [Paenibacillus polymyxa]